MNFLKYRSFNANKASGILKYNIRFQETEAKTSGPKSIEITKDVIDQTIIKPILKPAKISAEVETASSLIVKIDDKPETKPSVDVEQIKLSFDDVPGPKTLRVIAKLISGIPAVSSRISTYAMEYVLTAGNKTIGSRGTQFVWGRDLGLNKWLANEYGPIVRLASPLGGDLLFISRPEYAEAIFRNEDRYPIRSMLDCLEKYRTKHRNYRHAGLVVSTGADWEKLRSQVKTPIDNMIDFHCEQFDKTSDQFMRRIKHIRDQREEMPKTFYHEIGKWCVESFSAVAFKRPLKLLLPLGYGKSSEQARLMNAYEEACENVRQCEIGLQLYKLFNSPSYKKLARNCDIIDNLLGKYIYEAQKSLRDDMQEHESGTTGNTSDGLSLAEALLLKEAFTPEDIMTIFLDMILVGAPLTSHATSFFLYHLCRRPRVQKKLYDELESVDKITPETLQTLKYFRACFKESLRLKPPMPVLTRVLTKDTFVHNFTIPKGTYVLYATHLASVKEEYFEDPLKFNPDRWLEGDHAHDNSTGFASLPFGYGPKSCLAPNMAELQIASFVTKLLQTYQIEYNYGDIQHTTKFMGMPNRPLKFRFINRNN